MASSAHDWCSIVPWALHVCIQLWETQGCVLCSDHDLCVLPVPILAPPTSYGSGTHFLLENSAIHVEGLWAYKLEGLNHAGTQAFCLQA